MESKLRNEGNEVVNDTNQLKLLAPDGKRRLTDVLDNNTLIITNKKTGCDITKAKVNSHFFRNFGVE